MKPVVAILVFCGLAVVVGYFSWAFHAMSGFGSWTGGSRALATMIVVGVVLTGGVTGILMWLAFYSSRKGYDEPPRYNGESPSPTQPGPHRRDTDVKKPDAS